MKEKIRNDYTSWLIIIGIVMLFLEFTFFNSGLIFSLLVQVGMIYIGSKRMSGKLGKLLFWGGIIFLVITVLSMLTFRFLLLAVLIHFLIQYSQTKKNPIQIKPVIDLAKSNLKDENLVKKKPLLTNVFFGRQRTPQAVYEWNDINIQAGLGDTVIDLSYTVLPKGETVIFIRNIVGNIEVLVPYDIEVYVNHTAMAGTARILDLQDEKMFNQSLQLHTADYESANQKVKIVSSMFAGNLEVKRV